MSKNLKKLKKSELITRCEILEDIIKEYMREEELDKIINSSKMYQ